MFKLPKKTKAIPESAQSNASEQELRELSDEQLEQVSGGGYALPQINWNGIHQMGNEAYGHTGLPVT